MPPKSTTDHYFDTVTLSNFALVGRLDLLVKRYGRRGYVTHEVLTEILDGIAAGYTALRVIQEAVEARKLGLSKALTAAERAGSLALLRHLSSGEASCIACATTRGGIVVTDDRTARDCCAERALQVTGTVGILKASCLDGALSTDEADTILKSMMDAGYHSPVERISGLL